MDLQTEMCIDFLCTFNGSFLLSLDGLLSQHYSDHTFKLPPTNILG